MSIEELLEKYKGAYASDFEVPSPSGSKASSDSEVSGDEEEESEEDESDVESNTSSSGIPKIISCKLFARTLTSQMCNILMTSTLNCVCLRFTRR